jgi:hypothetical protein
MVVASLVVSLVSALVSIASVVYAWKNSVAADRSAKAAEDSAQASKDSLAIEAARRLEERRPRLSGRVTGGPGRGELQVTLESEERLELVELRIPPGQGVSFSPNTEGVETPPDANAALCAFSHSEREAHGMEPREAMTWPVEVESGDHDETLRIEATCHGEHNELWESVLIGAPITLAWDTF